MKKTKVWLLALGLAAVCAVTGCSTEKSGAESSGTKTEQSGGAENAAEGEVASEEEMAGQVEVGTEDMQPIPGTSVKDGVYSVTVDSSSPMFHVIECELTVSGGKMTAVMTMGGTGYLYVYPGTGAEAVQDSEDSYIPFVEREDGKHTFEIPVEALDSKISCAAFSKNKEKWYDRILVFRADSMPQDAFSDGVITTVDSLKLADGNYPVKVTLEGGSGRATVESPTELVVKDGKAYARIIWSSPNFDYMRVDGEKYEMVNTEGNSVFEIPVSGFDWKMPVQADTIAMSEPHEIAYTLYFESDSITKAE